MLVRLLLLCLLACWHGVVYCASQDNVVHNIYIDTSGNNKFEAKLKAHKYGMRRAMSLVLSKMGMSDLVGDTRFTLADLKSVFSVAAVKSEFAEGLIYKATVDYRYSPLALRSLVRKYNENAFYNSVYNAVIIPVFKKSGEWVLYDKSIPWIKFWYDALDILQHNRLLLPTNMNLDYQTISKMSIKDFADQFSLKLFDQVVFVICDHIGRDRRNNSYIRIKYRVVDTDGAYSEFREYNRPPVMDTMQINGGHDGSALNKGAVDDAVMHDVLDDILDLYGTPSTKEIEVVTTKSEVELNEYIFHLRGYSKSDIDEIKSIMGKIPEFSRCDFIDGDGKSGTITVKIYTTCKTDEQIAEALYINGLSYTTNKTGKFLVKLMYGV